MKFKLVLVFTLSMFYTYSQDTLTLTECFERVDKCRYSLLLENADLASAAVDLNFHKLSILPSISAYSNVDYGFGRVLDNFSNEFSTDQFNSQGFGVSSSLQLFNGLNYFKGQNKLKLVESQMQIRRDQSLNSLYAEVVSLYIDVCLKQSQLELSKKRLGHFEHLLEVQRQLFKAGKITQIDTLRTQNLVIKEESEKIRLDQSLKTSELQLNVLMGADLNEHNVFDASDISEANRNTQHDEPYLLKTNLIELELLSAEEKLARSNILPSLSFSASIGTGYSTRLKSDPTNSSSPTMAFRDQLDLNWAQNVGFQLSVPIFNNGTYLKNARLRKIKEDQLLAQSELIELNLEKKKKEVELSYNSAVNQYLQIEKSVANLESIYQVTMESYKMGKITFSELQEVFIEWQAEILNLESTNFEVLRLKLLRAE